MDMSQFEGDGEACGDGGGDEEVDEAEMMKALELNRQLKAMMEQMSEQEMAQMMEMQQAQAHAKQPQQARQGGGGPSGRGGGKRSDGAPSIMGPDGPGMVARRPKNNYTMSDEEMNRVARDNNHLLQRMVDIHKSGISRKGGGFSFNEKYYDDTSRHVSSHSINRRKASDKISQENAKFAQRLNSVRASVPSGPSRGGGGGGIRSTGYAHVSAGIGPLARKNELAARAPRPPRLEHPEMQF